MKRRFFLSVLITLFAAMTSGASKVTVFQETFDQCEGTGGNDDKWSGSIASSTLYADNVGWSFIKGNGANQCAKFGTGSAKGSATTPYIKIDPTKTYTLSFKAGAWAGEGNKTLVVSVIDELEEVIGKATPSSVTIDNATWTSFNVVIDKFTEGTTQIKIRIEAGKASNNRFFLDEVELWHEGEVVVSAPTFSPKAGTYYSPQSVSLSAGSNASIYYTTDGSTPSASSTHYTAPFTVSTTTTVKAIAIEGERSSEVSEATYTIAELPADAYMRVNNASELQEGDRLLFVGKVGETYYAMSEQSTNNRRSVMLTSADEVLAAMSEGAEVFTLCKEEGHWIFMDKNNKYLASTGSGSNYRLQSISTKSLQTLADVSINTAGEATIFFTENAYKDDKGDTSMDGNPYMRFNQNRNGDTYNPLFSCYRTADSQQPVYIYRRPGEPVRDIPATPTFSLASGMYNEAQSTTISCETEGAVIHYTTDGTEPTAESPEYTSAIAFALDPDQAVRTTVKAIAVKKGVSSEMAVLKVTVNPFMYQYKAVKSEEGLVEGDTYIVLARDGEHAAGVVNESNYRIYAVAASADSYTFEGAVATLPLESPVAVYTLSGSEGAWVMTDKVGNLCLPNTDNTNVTYNRNATLRINFRDGMAQISGQDGRLLTYRDRSVSEDVNEQVFRNYSVKNSASKGYQTVRLYKVVTKREELNQYDLSDVLKAGTQGDVTISGFDLQGVATFTAGGANYLVVKDADDAQYLNAKPEENDKDFAVEGHNQMDYPQNNWLLVNMGEGSATEYVGKTLTTINGTLAYEGGVNPVMTNANIAVGEDAETYEPNVYCPVNFLGESSVTAGNPAQKGNYFFMQPKRCEFATITWAVYNALDGAFYVPQFEGGSNVNGHAFPGGFDVDWSMNAQGDVHERLRTDAAYRFSAVVMEAAAQSNTARRIEAGSSRKGTKYVVFPVNLDPDVVTGVIDVFGAKEVKSVRYFNIMGVESAEPVDGVNIVVTTYTDGTSSSAKMLR